MSSHKCMIKAYFFHSIITILCFVITSSPSYGQEDKQYSTCNSSYTCGNIQNISFPFWGGDRPQECGLPGFELKCEAEHDSLIQIDGHNFRVLDINGDNQTMRIARNDLEEDICPDRYGNTSLNDAPFRYGPNYMVLILLYACPFDIPSEWKNFTFSCNNTGESSHGFYPDQSFISFWGPQYGSCERNVIVPVLLTAFKRFQDQGSTKILELLKQGFDVVYNKSLVCMACERSGGLCWSETDFAEPTCLCRDRTYSYYCGFVQEQGDNRHISVKIALGISAAGIGIVVICYMIYWFVFKKLSATCLLLPKQRREHQNVEAFLRQYGSLSPKVYSYSDIRKMTNSLQQKLGQGVMEGSIKVTLTAVLLL